jgi:hypothetical protein
MIMADASWLDRFALRHSAWEDVCAETDAALLDFAAQLLGLDTAVTVLPPSPINSARRCDNCAARSGNSTPISRPVVRPLRRDGEADLPHSTACWLEPFHRKRRR